MALDKARQMLEEEGAEGKKYVVIRPISIDQSHATISNDLHRQSKLGPCGVDSGQQSVTGPETRYGGERKCMSSLLHG